MICPFCSIAQKKTSAKVLYEDDMVMAFRDLHPQAPVHFLIIPKKHIASIVDAQEDDRVLLGHMMYCAQRLAKVEDCEKGFRLVMNCDSDGGQTVYHIHLHVLGQRQMQWPPG